LQRKVEDKTGGRSPPARGVIAENGELQWVDQAKHPDFEFTLLIDLIIFHHHLFSPDF
jgi:hypothetical protein